MHTKIKMDIRVIRRAMKRTILFPAKFFLFACGLFLYYLLILLQPLIKVRIGELNSERMGHLAADTELYLRRRSLNKAPKQTHIFFSLKPANYQLLKMMQRRMPIIKTRWAFWVYIKIRLFIGDSNLWVNLPNTEGEKEKIYYEFDNIPPQLTFTPKEELMGRELLKSMGIETGKPFVCLYVRDKAYLDKIHSYTLNQDWSYHNYRDCNIINYLPAAEYLASLGIFVVRMGYIVEQPLISDSPYIIDYATRYRSDFGDIYLSAKCKFFLSSDGGLITVPWIFNVPVAYTNGIPVFQAGWRKQDVFMSKKLWSRDKKRFLTFREILSCNADRWSMRQYQKAGIDVTENTPEEILGLVREINGRLDGTWVTSKEDEELQDRYRKIIPVEHKYYGFTSRISTEFLRQNKELLE